MSGLTFGQKAVGVSFNPSGNPHVDGIKQAYAEIIDDLADARAMASRDGDVEKQRLASIAITETQAAQMWAVKMLTWKD